MDKLLTLSQSKNTIFTSYELQEIFGNKNKGTFKNKLSQYVKKGILIRQSRWVYSLKNKEVNKMELANKIFSPSYISFFTALYHHSMIFQYEDDVYLAYMKTDKKEIEDFTIQLRCLKKEILLNPSGIIHNGMYSVASPERAFLDTIYLYGDRYFDNIDMLDYEKIQELFSVYNSPTLEKKAKSYF